MGETPAADSRAGTLAAFAAQIEEQATVTGGLRRELERLQAQATSGPTEVAPVHTPAMPTLARPAPAPTALAVSRRSSSSSSPSGRRGLLRRILGASAAATVLLAARDTPTTLANSRTTVVGASTDQYGIAAAVGGFDPSTLIGNLTGTGFGVIGTFSSPGFAPPGSGGVLGQGSGAFFGVVGLSAGNSGVYGQSASSAGVYGRSQSNAGVFGDSPLVAVAGVSGQGLGVQGTSVQNAGVFGQSTNNAAVFGTSPYAGVQGTSSQFGVWGITTNGTGVFGQATGASGFAGQFSGRVFVSGSFTVVNGAKSAAVKRKDGSLGRVYCQESPEPWFEDFGSGELKNGQASVALNADFDEVVKGDDYRVFLTEIGDCGGLYISRKGPHRFEVRSRGGAAISGTFDYRVVARRADPVGGRLEKVEIPGAPTPRTVPQGIDPPKLARA